MLHQNKYFRSIITITVLLLMVNPLSAAPADAYGGYVSDNRVNQEDKVDFSGTFHNFENRTIYVVSFNVSFVENIGEETAREPARPNASRLYPESDRGVPENSSLTETLTETIDFEPGSYNVSIYFLISETRNVVPSEALDRVYALVNQTFVVEGLTEGLEVAQTIGIIIGVIVVAVIGLLIYNAKFKKSY